MTKPEVTVLSIVGPRKLGQPDKCTNGLNRFYSTFTNLDQVDFAFRKLDKLVSSLVTREKRKNPDWCAYDHLRIISGGAQGADELGRLWALKNQYHFTCFPAQWDRFNKPAGFIRNKILANDSDYVIAFWDGESKGTKHTIDLATKSNSTKLKIVRYEKLSPYIV